jgi:hypothetical protein
MASAPWMMPRSLAWFFRKRAHRYRMLILSRQPIPAGFTMAQHADDYIYAMEHLGWEPSIVECNLAGGPTVLKR